MTMRTDNPQRARWLATWWWRWVAHRRQIKLAVIDLRDRYGAAAHGIASNSARARGGAEHKRFWRRVARRLRRGQFAGDRAS